MHSDRRRELDNDFLVFAATPETLPSFVQVFDYGEGTAYVSISPATIGNVGVYTDIELTVRLDIAFHLIRFDI